VTDAVDAGEVDGWPAPVVAGGDTLGAGPCGGDCRPARSPVVGDGRLETVPAASSAAEVMVVATTLVTVPTVVRATPATGATTPVIGATTRVIGASTPVTVLSAGTTTPPSAPVTVPTVLVRTVVTFGATGASVCGDKVDVAVDTTRVTVWVSVCAPGAGGLGPAGSTPAEVLDTVCGADGTVLETACDTV
jgi:hypothetical protein